MLTWACEDIQPHYTVQEGCQTGGKARQRFGKTEGCARPVNRWRRLPARYKDHALRGNFAGSRDCQIEPDWLLIYTLTENGNHVRFERTGTHSDLFRQ
jgi:YafQ family addiction module toxin component